VLALRKRLFEFPGTSSKLIDFANQAYLIAILSNSLWEDRTPNLFLFRHHKLYPSPSTNKDIFPVGLTPTDSDLHNCIPASLGGHGDLQQEQTKAVFTLKVV
jgi:hypothetical protein